MKMLRTLLERDRNSSALCLAYAFVDGEIKFLFEDGSWHCF